MRGRDEERGVSEPPRPKPAEPAAHLSQPSQPSQRSGPRPQSAARRQRDEAIRSLDQRIGEAIAAPCRHTRYGGLERSAPDRELLVDLGLGEAELRSAAHFLLDERERLLPRAFLGDRSDTDLLEDLPTFGIAEIAAEDR